MKCKIFNHDISEKSCKYCSVICEQRAVPYILIKTDTLETWEKNLYKASEKLGTDFGTAIGEALVPMIDRYKQSEEALVKASRLAESILMDWDKEQQVELAKEVAVMIHKLNFKGD